MCVEKPVEPKIISSHLNLHFHYLVALDNMCSMYVLIYIFIYIINSVDGICSNSGNSYIN